jgi:hypothetical protein
MLEKELAAATNLARTLGFLHAAITAEEGDGSGGSVHVHAMESLFVLVLAFLTTTTTITAHSSNSNSSSGSGSSTREVREAFKGCVRACDMIVESFHEASAALQAHPDFAQVSARCADIMEQINTHHDAVEGAVRKNALF